VLLAVRVGRRQIETIGPSRLMDSSRYMMVLISTSGGRLDSIERDQR
jgi:hypothetical protein